MNWGIATAADIALPIKGSIVSGPFGSNISSKYFVEEGIPVIRGNNLSTDMTRFIDNGFVFITEDKAKEFHNCEAREEDLIFTAAGTLGQVGIIPKECKYETYIISNKQLRLRCDKTKVIPLFAFYWFSSPKMVRYIISRNTGSSIPLINLSILKSLPIPLPPLSVQKRIVDILRAYDDLIDNNNRRITLLEESMRLLYREWFVRLRFPGHERVHIVDGQPDGWERTKLKNVTSYINRGISPKYGDSEDRWVVNQKCIREGKLNTILARQHISDYGVDKRINFGDVLVNSTGMGTLGRVAQVHEELVNYTVDSHITIVRPNEKVECDYFGIFLLGLQSYFDQMGTGSTGQTELSRDNIANADFILPTTGLQKEFGSFVSTQRYLIQNLLLQNKKLIEARDLLLPRLMSGAISM